MARILKIKMGPLYSLDAVQQGDEFLLVFAERGAVHRRTQMKLNSAQAMRLAQFLAGIEGNGPPVGGLDETDPGEPPVPTLPNVESVDGTPDEDDESGPEK